MFEPEVAQGFFFASFFQCIDINKVGYPQKECEDQEAFKNQDGGCVFFPPRPVHDGIFRWNAFKGDLVSLHGLPVDQVLFGDLFYRRDGYLSLQSFFDAGGHVA